MSDRHISVRQAGSGQWRAVLAPPHEGLRAFVVGQYAGWSESTIAVVRRRELPVHFVPVILGFRAPFSVGGERLASFVAGAHRGFTIVESAGVVECLQVNLTHDAAYRLLRAPMSEIADRAVSLADVLGPQGARPVERLGNTDDWSARFDHLDRFLAVRLHDARGLSPDVRLAVAALAAASGDLRVRDLAFETGRSPQWLIRRFRAEIGLPPKTIARILRFNRALAQMAVERPDLAGIALDAGYFDQAHFGRDFHAFTGLSPMAFLRERDPELIAR